MHPERRPAPAPAAQLRLDDLGTPLIDVAFVVVDLETTGLDPARDRITEIGAVRSQRGEVVGELATLIHPGRSVPPAVTAVTGITDALLRGCPGIEQVLPSLVEFLRGGVFVAHNASFDHRFLQAALARDSRPPMDLPVLDTARLARRLLKDELRSMRLSVLATHLGARTTPNHRALPDARATLDVLHALIERAASLGATTLEDLLDLQRSTSDRTFRRIDLVKGAPRAPGTYRFVAADGEVLYVGTTNDLRTRLRRYFGQDRRRRVTDLVQATARVEWDVCPTAVEAHVREVRAIHHHRPRFNRRSRNPEKAAWVTLTTEAFPRLTISNKAPQQPALGPLGGRRAAEQVVEALEQATDVRPCRMRLRVRQDHAPCVLKELGRCAAPCDGSQSRDAYDRVVDAVRNVLEGGDPSALRSLRTAMRSLAQRGRYEQAAAARQRLHALTRALDRTARLHQLAAVPRLVVARPGGARGWEAVEVVHGRLVRSWAVADPTDVTLGSEAPLPASASTVDPLDVEEILLLSSWLDGRGARVLLAEGQFTSRLAGGRLVADSLAEARQLERRLRKDRIQLQGEKVATAS